MTRIPFLLAAILVLPGCIAALGRFNENDPVSMAAVAKLEPGKSTAREVSELLGAPANVRRLGLRTAYLYRHTKSRISVWGLVLVGLRSDDIRQDRVWVFFDENDVLTHYAATLSAHRARVSFPWTKLHDPEKNAERDAERRESEGVGGSGKKKKE